MFTVEQIRPVEISLSQDNFLSLMQDTERYNLVQHNAVLADNCHPRILVWEDRLPKMLDILGVDQDRMPEGVSVDSDPEPYRGKVTHRVIFQSPKTEKEVRINAEMHKTLSQGDETMVTGYDKERGVTEWILVYEHTS